MKYVQPQNKFSAVRKYNVNSLTPGTILFSENHIHLTEEYRATKSHNGIIALDSYINSGTVDLLK